MTLFTDMYQHMAAKLMDCPKPIVMQKIVDVWRDFCKETYAWQYELDPFFVGAGVTEYELDGIPDESEIITVTKAETGSPTEDSWTTLVGHQEYEFGSGNTFTLTSTPTATSSHRLRVTVALRPTISATGICDEIYNEWRPTAVSGVLGALLMIPRKPWSDQALGGYHKTQHRIGVCDARIWVNRDRLPASIVMKPIRRFA